MIPQMSQLKDIHRHRGVKEPENTHIQEAGTKEFFLSFFTSTVSQPDESIVKIVGE